MSGQASHAYLHEPVDDYGGSPSDTTYKRIGKNPSLDDLTIENALTQLRIGDNPELADAIATTFEGALGLSFVPTNPWYLNHHFGQPPTDGGESSAPYSYTWDVANGRAQSARFYDGFNHLDGTVERVLTGTVFPQWSLDVSIGEPVRASLTGFFGDEEPYNTSVTPGTIEGDEEPLIFHGGTLKLGGSKVNKIQSATLNSSTGISPQRTWSAHPVDARMGQLDSTLDISSIITGTDQLGLAYGGSTPVTEPQDDVGNISATLEFTTAGDHALTVDIPAITTESYSWEQLFEADADTLENATYRVHDLTATAESTESSAL
jgi:hypothetical protein